VHRRVVAFGFLVWVLSLPTGGHTQQGQQQGGMGGGIASGVASKPVYDEQKRPITAGGFVDKGPIIFEDDTKKTGLSGWVHKMGVPRKDFIVETNGSGVCLIDYNNDGWLDIYLVNGAMSQKRPACRTIAGAMAAR